MDFRPQDMKTRLLSPRIVIYLVLLIAAVWLMRRFEKYQQEEQPAPAVTTAVTAPRPFHSPPDAALRAPAARTPMLVVFFAEKNEATTALAAESRRHLQGRCAVAELQVTPDVAAKFNLKQLPAAILFNADNRELARHEGDLTAAKLDALAAKLPQ